MHTTAITPIVIASTLALASLAACGGTRQSPSDPTSTTTTTSTTAPAGTGGITSGTFPVKGAFGQSASPTAAPLEGGCREGEPRPDARDLEMCLDSCKGKDDTVPLGSSCISAKEACTSQCNEMFAR